MPKAKKNTTKPQAVGEKVGKACIYVQLYRAKDPVPHILPINEGMREWKGLQRALKALFPSKRSPFVLLDAAQRTVPPKRWCLFLIDGAFFHVVANARSASFRPTTGLPTNVAPLKEDIVPEPPKSWTILFSAASRVTAFKFEKRPTVADALATYCERYKMKERTLSVVLEDRTITKDDHDTLLDDNAKFFVVYEASSRAQRSLTDPSRQLGTVVSTTS